MHASTAVHAQVAPSAATASALAGVFVDECDRDSALVSLPRPEVHVVVRFGASARRGIDVHASGFRDHVHRKHIRAGQWTVSARLQLGSHMAVLGVPATDVAGRIIALDDVWGEPATRRLLDRLSNATTKRDAAAIVECAIAERVASAPAADSSTRLALRAADRLATASVGDVASELAISERHLRRIFRDAIGVGPKTFAKLARFRRALRAAWSGRDTSWASIAAAAGYYDQAHLIEDFHAIAGTTPRALVHELTHSAFPPLGPRQRADF